MRQIYLDYNATTPIAPSVFEAMRPFLTEHFGNPSSSHAMGRVAYQAVEDARERVASLLGCCSDELYFTSGGTESNNLAIFGAMLPSEALEKSPARHLIISAVEHPATTAPAQRLKELGFEVTIVPTDNTGRVDPQRVADAIRDDTVLVSIMHANNEIGTIQPIREISEVCRARRVLLHTDAAQSIGKVRTQVDELGVDLLSLAGHKLYAPKGVGALYVRRGTRVQPFTRGAGHERGLRPGTENVAALAGLGQAAHLAARSVDENQSRINQLRNRLFEQLQAQVSGSVTCNGDLARCLPNTLSVNFPEVVGSELLERAPEICASTGSACHSGTTQLSSTLAAINLDPSIARGTVRLSLGWNTSEEEVDRAASALSAAWESLTAKC